MYDAVDQALPGRDLRIPREALIPALLGQIQIWLELAPHVRPHIELKFHCAALADDIRRVLAKTGAALRRLGVREADVIADQRLYRHTAERDLYRLCWSTMIKLGDWDRVWCEPPKRRRRKSFAAALTERLKEYCDLAGLSTKEFADFLSNGMDAPTP